MVAFSVAVSTREAFGAYLPSWAKYDFSAELPTPDIPVHALVGAHDPALGEDTIRATWAAQLPGSQVTVLPDAGHYAMFESPVVADDRDREDARGLYSRVMTQVLHDPATYVGGVPFELLEQLRSHGPVAWLDEPELPGLPAGPGYHLVLSHALVTHVLSRPREFSSAARGTQIRDPASEDDLRYVRRMMLNMDPPEHSRLRRMVSRSFTPAGGGGAGTTDRRPCAAHRRPDARRAGASVTSPRTSPPICRCSRWPTCSACPPRTAG